MTLVWLLVNLVTIVATLVQTHLLVIAATSPILEPWVLISALVSTNIMISLTPPPAGSAIRPVRPAPMPEPLIVSAAPQTTEDS